MERIEHSLDRKHNPCEQIQDDKLRTNDLKLSVGLMHDDGNIIIRFPKSRVSRRRFKSSHLEGDD